MKRFLILAVLAVALALPNLARAQYPGPQGPMMFASICIG